MKINERKSQVIRIGTSSGLVTHLVSQITYIGVRMFDYVQTSDHQFGFKRGHSTLMLL